MLALYTLGLGDLDPVSLYALEVTSADEYVDLAERYERMRGMWHPGFTRAIVHALLSAEVGAFLGRPSRGWLGGSPVPKLESIRLSHPEQEYREHPKLKGLHDLREKQQRSAERRITRGWLLSVLEGGAIGAGLGAITGRWLGGVCGFLAGASFASLAHAHGLRLIVAQPERRLRKAMQFAVIEVGEPQVSWVQLARHMEEAAALGAVWAPEAWRLVDRARRRDVATRIYGRW